MTQLGKYEILEELGRGGFAAVYKARDTQNDRLVALKVMAPHLLWDTDFARRFRAEFETVAALHHPNIVSVYEHAEADGQPYIAMEVLPGVTLKQLLEKHGGPLSLEQALRLVQQVASALTFALRRGIVHRDLKPSNIMVDAQGRVKLTDFGLAKATARTVQTTTGRIFGTPEYMSPEQVRGDELDHRSDVYALGVILYQVLTGKVPFANENPLAVIHGHCEREPPPPSELNPALPAPVEAVVLKALAKSRADRFQSAQELAHYLRRAIAGQPLPEKAPAPQARATGRRSRRRVALGLLTGLVCLVVLGSVLTGLGPSIFAQSTPAQTATRTPAATLTVAPEPASPVATNTALPTDTLGREPSPTPVATGTSAPTSTQRPPDTPLPPRQTWTATPTLDVPPIEPDVSPTWGIAPTSTPPQLTALPSPTPPQLTVLPSSTPPELTASPFLPVQQGYIFIPTADP
jgi:serine/threonine protein kinase